MRRWLALIGITGALALGIGVALPPQAAQAITPGGAFDPINVLPSTVKGGLSGVGPAQMGKALQAFYGYIMPSMLQQASAAKLAAPAAPPTPANAAALAAAKSRFRIPVGSPSSLIKGVGPQAVAMVGFQVGTMIGGGVLDVMGIDEAGTVCGTGPLVEGFQNFVTGLDCDAFRALPDYVPNVGLTARPAGWTTNVFGTGWNGSAETAYWACNVNGTFKTASGSMPCQILKGDQSQGGILSSWSFYCKSAGSPPLRGEASMTFDGSATYQGRSFTPGTLAWDCPQGGLPYSLVFGSGSGSGAAATYDKPPDADTLANSSSRAEWYASSSPYGAQFPGTSADPLRHFECVVATSGQSYTAVSSEFHETDADWPTPVCPSLPEGVFPTSTSWYLVGGGERHLLNTETASPEFTTAAATHPECMDGSCTLQLLRSVAGVEKSCFDSPTDCEGWFESPTKADQYVCRYGGKVVALSECTVYAPTFKPQTRDTTDYLGDPTTGTPIVNPVKPGTGTDTGTDADRAECFPTGWGLLNPFEWVVKPVGCALRAAFVPRQSVVDATIGAIPSKFDNTTPGRYIAAIELWDFQSVSGCAGLRVDLSWIPAANLTAAYYMPACPGDFFDDIAPLFKFFMYGSIGISGYFGAKKVIGSFVGMSA